jgi:hypothetical protein
VTGGEGESAGQPARGGLSRRRFVRGTAGLAALTMLGGLLKACASAASPSATGRLTLGSNYADETPRRALAEVVDDFTAKSGIEVVINTVAPGPFQDRIGAYLQGTPDDVFSWFGGNRMRFFAERGLASDISDVWADLPNQTDGARRAATGNDGRQYLVPFITYPWVIVYRASAWQWAGYEQPDTLGRAARPLRPDAVRRPGALRLRQSRGLAGDGHVRHPQPAAKRLRLPHRPARGPRAVDGRARSGVFEQWRALLPYHQAGAAGRTWQEAARSMLAGEAGMIFLGTFAAEQATADERDDLAIIPFPQLGPTSTARWPSMRRSTASCSAAPQPTPPPRAISCEFVATPEAQTAYVTRQPEPHSDGRRRRREATPLPAPDGRGHCRRRPAGPVLRPRHAAGLRRPGRHAVAAAGLPPGPGAGPRRLPGARPATSGIRSTSGEGDRFGSAARASTG